MREGKGGAEINVPFLFMYFFFKDVLGVLGTQQGWKQAQSLHLGSWQSWGRQAGKETYTGVPFEMCQALNNRRGKMSMREREREPETAEGRDGHPGGYV